MRKLLIISCLLISMPVFADVPKWLKYADNAYVDLNYKNYSYDQDNKTIKVWFKVLNNGEMPKLGNKKIWYATNYMIIDCNNKKNADIAIKMYDLKDELLFQENYEESQYNWSYYSPDRKLGGLLEVMCNKTYGE